MLDEFAFVVGVEDVGRDVAVPAAVEVLLDMQEYVGAVLESPDDLDVARRVALGEVGEELDEPFLAVFDRCGVLGLASPAVRVDGFGVVSVSDRLEVEGGRVVQSLRHVGCSVSYGGQAVGTRLDGSDPSVGRPWLATPRSPNAIWDAAAARGRELGTGDLDVGVVDVSRSADLRCIRPGADYAQPTSEGCPPCSSWRWPRRAVA